MSSATQSSSLFFESSLFESSDQHQQHHPEDIINMSTATATEKERSRSFVLGESVFGKFNSSNGCHHPSSKSDFFMPSIDETSAVLGAAAISGGLTMAADSADEASCSGGSPIMNTVSPLEIHSSLIESIFDPAQLDSTPMFDDEINVDESKSWVSLFDESEIHFEQEQEQKPIETKKKRKASEFEQEQQLATPSATPLLDSIPNKRSKSTSSSISSSSSSSSVDHLGVVSYNRKQRSNPLTPVIPTDESDPIASKRARNTEAARRSRARKMERMSQLEDKVEGLLKRNSDLEDEVLRLRALLSQSHQSQQY